jgi:hypothetical protein
MHLLALVSGISVPDGGEEKKEEKKPFDKLGIGARYRKLFGSGSEMD